MLRGGENSLSSKGKTRQFDATLGAQGQQIRQGGEGMAAQGTALTPLEEFHISNHEWPKPKQKDAVWFLFHRSKARVVLEHHQI